MGEKKLTITFIRHGNTSWNNERRAQGHSHNPLSETGITQAHALGARLSKEVKKTPFDFFISSDLKRAEDTAKIISEYIRMPISFLDKRLREIGRGLIEGMIEEERIQKWGENWSKLDLEIETKQSVQRRGMNFLNEMIERYPECHLLVVSHGILIKETLEGILPKDMVNDALKNTSVTRLNLTEKGWECNLYNCIHHLGEISQTKI